MDIDGKLYCPRCMREIEREGDCPHCGYSPSDGVCPSALGMGTLLNGRYQLCAVIGQGGFGITYAAWDELLGAPVAIKEYFPLDFAVRDTEISDEVETPENSRAVYLDGMLRFQRESHLLAELQGIREIVKVLDFFSENNTAYIVMEFIRGVPVDEWVRSKKLGTDEILELMRPVVDALVSTHRQGVLHRDLTPSNILVCEDGAVKLIDFGSATEQERSKGTVILTRKYAPIEQYGSEHGTQGPWTDVYGIGAVLYTLLCGEAPQEAVLRVYDDKLVPPDKHGVRLKKYQNAAIIGALKVTPDGRTQSMDEFRSLLYHLPAPEMIRRQKRFMRRLGIAAAILFALIAVIAANFSVGLPLGQGLLYSLRSDGWHVKGELHKEAARSIPEARLGIGVTRIDDGAFRGDETLVDLAVPGNVLQIGDSAFYGCKQLKYVVLQDGVKSLGATAFAECPALVTAVLPETLAEIEDTAFFGAPDSASLLVHTDSFAHQWAQKNNVGCAAGLEYRVTGDSAAITALSDAEGKLALPSELDGKPVTQIADGIRITQADTVTLPRFLTAIPDSLFADFSGSLKFNDHLTAVHIGENVQSIGASAFYGCRALKSIALPESLYAIGDSAFFDAGLEALALPKNLRRIGEYAFAYTHISSIALPEGITTFGSDAFTGIRELNHIDLPESLVEIPDRAFRASGIRNLRLPGHLKIIGEYAFWNSDLECLVIPESVEELGGGCFLECRNLKCVYMNLHRELYYNSHFFLCKRSVYICGDQDSIAPVFAMESGCRYVDTALWSAPDLISGGTAAWYAATVPDELVVPFINVEEGVLIDDTYIIDALQAEQDCLLKELTLSPFQTEIRDCAFFWCQYLEKVRTEGTILSVGQQAFEFCLALSEIPLEHARYIYSGAFTSCQSLKAVTVSDDLIYLDANAFEYCDNIRVLNLPDLAD